MTAKSMDVSKALNLFAASSAFSVSSIPASSIHYLGGAALFSLGMACAVASAFVMTPKENRTTNEQFSLKSEFLSAVSSTAVSAVSLASASFYAIHDIVTVTPMNFVGLGAGFAMATGMVGFYGGLRTLASKAEQNDPEPPSGP